MKFTELDDAEVIVTKDYLDAKLAELKADITQMFLDQQKSMTDFQGKMYAMVQGQQQSMMAFQGRLYAMVVGTYALIIVGIFINHFWR